MRDWAYARLYLNSAARAVELELWLHHTGRMLVWASHHPSAAPACMGTTC